jgi:hypothetical protein
MGEFKPLVKMYTTEPSVELKLKKGGSATHKRMHAEGAKEGFKPVKKGGEVESPAQHKAEMKAIKGVGKELKQHEGMPASKAHKGLKTGGIAKSTKPGGYKTGGVVNGQGGYKDGGMAMVEKGGKMVPDFAADGKGKMKKGGMMGGGMMGGYKKGGASKKHFATGGTVNNSGHAVAMSKKAPSSPVAISRLSGAFKKGGEVC